MDFRIPRIELSLFEFVYPCVSAYVRLCIIVAVDCIFFDITNTWRWSFDFKFVHYSWGSVVWPTNILFYHSDIRL